VATSGSSNFNLTAVQIVKGALRAIRAIDPGQTPTADEISDGIESLNMMVKLWQATPGLSLWTKEEATLFIDKGTMSYTFPTAYATQSFADTTTSAAASSGASTISVTSATGITAADFLSIELDSGSRQWTTVGSISGTTVTLPTGTTLTGDVASGNEVIAFTSKIVKPLKIMDARRIVSSVETPFDVIDYHSYQSLPNKSQTGLINEASYLPKVSTGILYVWPTGNTATDRISFTWARPIEDFDAQADNPDLPPEWLEALKFNLAVRLAPEYGTPDRTFSKCAILAQNALDVVSWDAEQTSVYFVPE